LWRDFEAELLRGLEIDYQLELGRLLDRQIGGLGACENPAGIGPSLAPYAGEARSIADQAAGLDAFPQLIDRRNGMTCC